MLEVDFEGWEFDWFATDSFGNFAIVATAGEGILMPQVIENYKDHQLLSETLDSPKWGSPDVWDDYSSIGLYVFDWKLHGGPYNKVANPSKKISDKLRKEILDIRGLPIIKTDFREIEILSNEQKNM